MAFKKGGQSRMKVVRPVIPDDIDFRGLPIAAGNCFQALMQPWHGHTAEVKRQYLSLDGIEKPYYPHTGIRRVAISHFGLPSAYKGPKPSLAWLPIEADLIFEQGHDLFRFLSGLFEGLFQAPFFLSYRGSGL